MINNKNHYQIGTKNPFQNLILVVWLLAPYDSPHLLSYIIFVLSDEKSDTLN